MRRLLLSWLSTTCSKYIFAVSDLLLVCLTVNLPGYQDLVPYVHDAEWHRWTMPWTLKLASQSRMQTLLKLFERHLPPQLSKEKNRVEIFPHPKTNEGAEEQKYNFD